MTTVLIIVLSAMAMSTTAQSATLGTTLTELYALHSAPQVTTLILVMCANFVQASV